jgi:hypothetical protein
MPTLTRRYYPTLSTIVSQDDIPEILGFLKDGIENLFSRIHYKDLQYAKSPRGDGAFYSLSIVSPNRLDIELPGTGIFLILNPDLTGGDSHISSFPITIEYQWKILAYLRGFSQGGFSYSPRETFELALRALNISEEQVLAHFINVFVEPESPTVSKLEQFVTDINTKNSEINLPAPTEDTTLKELAEDIFQQSNGQYSSLIGFKTYIEDSNIEDTFTKVKTYFRAFTMSHARANNTLFHKIKISLPVAFAIVYQLLSMKKWMSSCEIASQHGIH